MARLAGLYPAGVICEIMNEDGTMARMPDLEKFASLHDLPILTIKELIERSKPARASDCPMLYAISDGSATFLDIDARKGGLSWEQIYLEVLGERTVVARCHPEGLTEVFALVPLRRDRSRQTLDDEGRALARRCAESPIALPR